MKHALSGRLLGVGLYGINGHQIQAALADESANDADKGPAARLVAVAGVPDDALPESLRDPGPRRHPGLEALLDDPEVELVSLCSPRRDQQAKDAMRALERGKHVYAEKPCAVDEPELDRLLDAARASGRRFLEMGDTVFAEPWYALRQLVRSGALGEIVQVHAQKSYPWHEGRSPDDGVDGGLVAWVGVHAFRMVEQIGGARVAEVCSTARSFVGDPGRAGSGKSETDSNSDPAPACGSGGGGRLAMAAACLCALENGGLATVTANYLNPKGFPRWGNESLRLFGTLGMAEITDGGARSRWYDAQGDRGEIPPIPPPDYFAALWRHFRDGAPMPFDAEEMIHPTRVALRAKRQCAIGNAQCAINR